MNNSINIIFSGTIKDKNGKKTKRQFNIPSNSNEFVKDLISRFYQITGLDPNCHKLYFQKKNLINYESSTLLEIGLVNNSIIEITYIELESMNFVENDSNDNNNSLVNNDSKINYNPNYSPVINNNANIHYNPVINNNSKINKNPIINNNNNISYTPIINNSANINYNPGINNISIVNNYPMINNNTNVKYIPMVNNNASIKYIPIINSNNNNIIQVKQKVIPNYNNNNINYYNYNFNNNTINNYNPLNYEISIKFIKYSEYSAFNCYTELNGILKLCLLNEIASKIDDSILDNLYIIKKISETIYFILKILKKNYVNITQKNQAAGVIEKIMRSTKGCNVINFSNFVNEEINQIILQQLINLVPQKDLIDINDTRFRLGKYVRLMSFFEQEIKGALAKSLIEFTPISLVVIDREYFDKFETERIKCPNRCKQLLFHGTQVHPISCILTGIFKKSEVSGYQHGKGVYFTDSLDYCWFYGGTNSNRQNMNKIPLIGETFTAICSQVYYDKNGFLQVTDYSTREYPKKNEINFSFAGATFETITVPDFSKFVGTEYVVNDLDQICPIISVKFKREEFCVIWCDDNFSEKNIYNNESDGKFKNYLKERIKYCNKSAKYNVYTFINADDALLILNRKKYNKIILISNVGINKKGLNFVEKARQIIGNDVIVLFFALNEDHLKWITQYRNALFSNQAAFFEEYLDIFGDMFKMKQLIGKMENFYNVKFKIDDNFLYFPLFKENGHYSDLIF